MKHLYGFAVYMCTVSSQLAGPQRGMYLYPAFPLSDFP